MAEVDFVTALDANKFIADVSMTRPATGLGRLTAKYEYRVGPTRDVLFLWTPLSAYDVGSIKNAWEILLQGMNARDNGEVTATDYPVPEEP